MLILAAAVLGGRASPASSSAVYERTEAGRLGDATKPGVKWVEVFAGELC